MEVRITWLEACPRLLQWSSSSGVGKHMVPKISHNNLNTTFISTHLNTAGSGHGCMHPGTLRRSVTWHNSRLSIMSFCTVNLVTIRGLIPTFLVQPFEASPLIDEKGVGIACILTAACS